MRCDATDIDFARFLGNVETFAGINRDRAPFVFTPEFAYIMGGKGSEHYNQFSSLCCRAFNILRRHSGLFVNLLNLVCGTFTKSLTPPPPPRCSLARSLAHSLLMQMLSTGLPELHDREDIRYLEEKFMPQLSTKRRRDSSSSYPRPSTLRRHASTMPYTFSLARCASSERARHTQSYLLQRERRAESAHVNL